MKTYSVEHSNYLKKNKREKLLIIIIQSIIFISFIILWEVLSKYKIINTFLYSSPSRIISTISSLFLSNQLLPHIGITTIEILISFIISTILGIIISTILWYFKKLSKIVDPYLTVLNSLPKVALGPLIIIWFGANIKSILFMSLLISLFVTIINIYQGFISVPENYIILAKSFHTSKIQIFRKVIFPYNRENILSTIKVNLSMNFIGVIMGELLVSKKGLGYLIMYGSQVFNLDLVITSIILLCLFSYLTYLLIQKIK